MTLQSKGNRQNRVQRTSDELHYRVKRTGPQAAHWVLMGWINYVLRNPELYNLADDPKESYDCASRYPEVVATIQKSIQEQLATLPDQVKQAYRKTQQHLSTPTMPADSLPEFRNSEGNSWAWLRGAEAEKVLQRFK
jgi:hypothetical protein